MIAGADDIVILRARVDSLGSIADEKAVDPLNVLLKVYLDMTPKRDSDDPYGSSNSGDSLMELLRNRAQSVSRQEHP